MIIFAYFICFTCAVLSIFSTFLPIVTGARFILNRDFLRDGQLTPASTSPISTSTAPMSTSSIGNSSATLTRTTGSSSTSSTTRFSDGTATPASNNEHVTLPPTRSPCSSNGEIKCNPRGGPGLSTQPNFLIFVTDDLGRSDVSFTEGNLQTPTPNIDKIAWDGVILNRHYSNPTCTPTRTAFMTGKYAFRTGMQTAAISEGEPWGVPLNFTLQPQYFKDLGYDTWATGKWHLGSYRRAYLPNHRGIDESYMITSGDANWFNYTSGWITPIPLQGRVLRENEKMVFANITNNNYLPELFTTVAEKWIRNANPNNPFWLYFATTAVHTAFEPYGGVLHTMPQYQLRPPVLSFTDQYPMRKKQLAIVQAMDESFKRLIDALTYKGIINNTIIVFFSDNGGAIPQTYAYVHGSNWGSNWPLRMGKGTLFEGGVRTPAFIWSPLMPKRGRVTNQLFHCSDWLPTLYEAAGGDPNQLGDFPGDLSGVSQWNSFIDRYNSGPRTELVNNIDTLGNSYAMIYQDFYGSLYKIIGGNVLGNNFLGWWRTPDTNASNPQTVWTPAKVDCNFPEGQEVSPCVPFQSDCLFDLTNDPCELNNIAQSYPSMLRLLRGKLAAYNATSIPSQIRPFDPTSNPNFWDDWWVPWLDPSPMDPVPLTFMPFNPSSSY